MAEHIRHSEPDRPTDGSRLIESSEGRHLAVKTFGDYKGYPIFYIPGSPGSRLGPHPRNLVLHQHGVKIISYDRPGYGYSDRHEGRTIADAATDVKTIADALGIDKFSVIGRSGGGPHALACAALLPERVQSAAALVSLAPPDAKELDWFAGMTPGNVKAHTSARENPEKLIEDTNKLAETILTDPSTFLGGLRSIATGDDELVLRDAGIRGLLLNTYKDALRHGGYGWADDILAVNRPWGFSVSDITVPTAIYGAERDLFSPFRHSLWLADNIPNEYRIVAMAPNKSHFEALSVLPHILTWCRNKANEVL